MALLEKEMIKRRDQLSDSASTSANSSDSSASTSLTDSSTKIAVDSSATKRNILMKTFDKQPVIQQRTTVEDELDRYLSSTSAITDEENDDILSFWKENQNVFPLIAAVARDILAIPASNTCVERLFSACKATITEKRTRLGSEKLNKIMFLQKNMDTLNNETRFSPQNIVKNIDSKRSSEQIVICEESPKKKSKPMDQIMSPRCTADYLVQIESDDESIV
jgi:hypothetical protein